MLPANSAAGPPRRIWFGSCAEKVAKEYGLDTRTILIALVRRKMVGG